RRIAAGITSADPALLDNRDTRHAVIAREIVRGRQAMAATAYDDGIVGGARRSAAPGLEPGMTPRRGRQKSESRVAAFAARSISIHRFFRRSQRRVDSRKSHR